MALLGSGYLGTLGPNWCHQGPFSVIVPWEGEEAWETEPYAQPPPTPATHSPQIFTYERKWYSRKDLARHRMQGDPDDTSHRGHPLCKFCDERYLDNDELLKHLRRDHYFCHFCDSDGAQDYYRWVWSSTRWPLGYPEYARQRPLTGVLELTGLLLTPCQ